MMFPSHLIHVLLAIITFLSTYSAALSQEHGHFKGIVQVEWLDDGRKMKTISEIVYTDSDGLTWRVPAGTITDGASTPRATWTAYPPFSGKYRKAALIHDYYCVIRERSWQDTHDMFYSALRAAGMDEINSQIMWGAVYMQGPRWELDSKRSLLTSAKPLSDKEKVDSFNKLAEWVKVKRRTRDQLEQALVEGNFD